MSALRREVRPGLTKYQDRIDIRDTVEWDFTRRRALANGHASINTPIGHEIIEVRWAVNTDFLPGFFMSVEWLAEEPRPPRPTPTTEENTP